MTDSQSGNRSGRTRGSNSIHKSVLADLEKRLDAGEWTVGRPIPSLRKLALHYNVGVKTIWNAVNALRKDGRVRITHGRSAIATVGAPATTILKDAIAVVLSTNLDRIVHSNSRGPLWKGVVRSIKTSGFTLIVLQHDTRWRSEFPAGLRDLSLRGVILIGPFAPEILKQYEQLPGPVVLLDQPGDEYKLHTVSISNHDAAFDATARLIRLGHRRLAFVRSLIEAKGIDPDSKEREAGFIKACKNAKISSDNITVATAGFRLPSSAARTLIEANPRATAVITASQTHAAQVDLAAREAGLSIPRDLSIVTFRAVSDTGRDYSGPEINFEDIGAAGVRIIEQKSSVEHVKITPIWHVGTTVGPPIK